MSELKLITLALAETATDSATSAADNVHKMGLGNAAIYSLVAILLVFVILLILIGITSLIFYWLNQLKEKNPNLKIFNKKKGKDEKKEVAAAAVEKPVVNYDDEDLVAAIIAASIDYRNEIKKDVKVVSVKEIK